MLGGEQASGRPSLTLWALCVAVLMGPAVLVWAVRLTALAAQCAPGPEACHGLPLGAGLRDALNLAWAVSTNTWILVGLSIAATLAAFRTYRPMLGAMTMLLLPVLSLVGPILAVLLSRYDDCPVSTDGIGSCQLWGASMGMSFHTAAQARDLLYGIVPITFSLFVMLALLGFFFCRPKIAPPPHPMAGMRRFDEEDWGGQ